MHMVQYLSAFGVRILDLLKDNPSEDKFGQIRVWDQAESTNLASWVGRSDFDMISGAKDMLIVWILEWNLLGKW